MRPSNVLGAAALLFSQGVLSHPGHDVTDEILERRAFLSSVKRSSLSHCAETLKARGVEDRNIRRRAAAVDKAREKRGLRKRDVDDVLAENHNRTDLGYTPNTPAEILFGSSNSCLLTPEVTLGPYYVGGEFIRPNIVEDQPGVEITLDYQVIDIDTCEPVEDVYLEIWHCNSTGVYSGVLANGNGDESDESNIDNTFLRGIQKTDGDGVAQFESLFPGHYTGRTTHIHTMIHTNVTVYPNHTLGNDVYSSHVGQTFFDQDLIDGVTKLSPYSSNTQELTTNEEDSILAEEAATDGVDPLMEYTLLGDDLSDGLFAWLSFGINTTLSDSVTPAVFYYEGGGVENEDSGPPGGPPGGPPSGALPPGFGDETSAADPSEPTSSSA